MRRADLITGAVLLAFSALYYFYLIPTQISFSIPPERITRAAMRPDFLPRISILLFALLSALLALGALRGGEPGGARMPGRRALFQAGTVLLISIAYVYALELVGFLASSPLFLAALITFMGTRDWRYVVSVALLFPLLVSYFFWFSFKVILPEGTLF